MEVGVTGHRWSMPTLQTRYRQQSRVGERLAVTDGSFEVCDPGSVTDKITTAQHSYYNPPL